MIWFVDDEDENNDVSIFMEMDVHCVQGPFQQEVYYSLVLSSNDGQSLKDKIQTLPKHFFIFRKLFQSFG